MDELIKWALNAENKTRTDIGAVKSLDWCAETVEIAVKSLNIPDTAKQCFNISCNQSRRNALDSGYWYEPEDDMQAGDIIYYNWNHDYDPDGNLDHTGIIVKVADTYIDVIEGNTQGRGMEAPVRRVRRYRSALNFNCEYPDYYIRYRAITPVPKSNSKLSELIKQLRAIADEIERIDNA